MAETRGDKEAIKQQVRTLPRPYKQALYAILDRYVEGEDLERLTCSTDLADTITDLGSLDILGVTTVSRQQDTVTLEITVDASDELVGELWQLLHDIRDTWR